MSEPSDGPVQHVTRSKILFMPSGDSEQDTALRIQLANELINELNNGWEIVSSTSGPKVIVFVVSKQFPANMTPVV